MTLYPYQQTFVNEILSKLKTNHRVLAQLPTGAGKTHSFCYIIKKADISNKKVLVLVHREELIKQTVASLNKQGVICEALTSRKRKLQHHTNCVVAMVETAYNRLQKNSEFFRNIDLIIADEVHIQIFEKVYDLLPEVKVIGFTATPTVLKRITFFKCEICSTEYNENTTCCGGETMEWTRSFSLSEQYNDIVVGIGIGDLIEQNKLVKEISIVKKSVDVSKLETDKTGEVTEKSQNHAFGASDSIKALINDYNTLCKGKKVLLFTGSTKVNKLILEALISEGINARSYDSVNNKSNEREDTVKWFKSNRDAVLVNTGVFTTGTDVPDIEVVIMYRATKSLGLYIQCVGRAARTTNKIYKENFLFIDYGGNIQEHGEFSDPTRDWERIFYQGIGKPKPKREVLESVTQCEECGILYPSSFPACTNCGETPKPKKKRVQKGEDYVLEPLRPMPPPSGNRIVEYAKSQDQGVTFCYKVLTHQIIDLFRFYSVTKEVYEKSKETGELDRKLDKIIRPAYFVIIRSGLSGANRRLSRVINDIKNKIEKYYLSASK